MTEFLKKIAGNQILISSILIIIGVLCIVLPKQILSLVSILFGVFLFVYALLMLASILSFHNNSLRIISAIFCGLTFVFSIILILNQDAGTMAVGLITGIWILLLGLKHIFQSFVMLPIINVYKIILGILEFAVAVIMFIHPKAMMEFQIIVLGALLIVYSIITICALIYAYRKAKRLHETMQVEKANKDDNTVEIVIEEDNK